MDLVDVSGLQEQLRTFSRARDWEQFHRPKNLAMAIAGEAGELAAVLQWLDSDEADAAVAVDGDLREAFVDEMADVLIYLVRLADVIDADLGEAAAAKMARNEQRFPPG
ncbi:MAG: nucleotide pyrophosphohydrolase [Acidimicrobiales bacterium]